MPTPNKNGLLTSLGSVATFFATSVGIPLERITKATGLSPSALMDPNTRIPEKFILEIFRLLGKIPSKKNLSLEFAQTVPFTFIGSQWQLLSKASDIRTIYTLAEQNSDLIANQLNIEFITNPTQAILKIHHPFDKLDGGFGGEVCIGFAARILREYFGDNILSHIQFQHPARKPISVYEDSFKVPVIFQSDYNALVSPIDSLDLPNKQELVESQETLEWRFTCLRHELGINNVDKLQDIRKAIDHNAKKGDYTVPGLAKHMAMSTRSLQRYMNGLGTNAKILLDEARYAKALELLANERISIDEISSQLGFNDERSFRKAFERWSQKSPAQVRRDMMQKE